MLILIMIMRICTMKKEKIMKDDFIEYNKQIDVLLNIYLTKKERDVYYDNFKVKREAFKKLMKGEEDSNFPLNANNIKDIIDKCFDWKTSPEGWGFWEKLFYTVDNRKCIFLNLRIRDIDLDLDYSHLYIKI